jgi:hypothetical protein
MGLVEYFLLGCFIGAIGIIWQKVAQHKKRKQSENAFQKQKKRTKETVAQTLSQQKEKYADYSEDWPAELKMTQAAQHLEMLQDSVELISKTVYCKTFFYRYDFAIENAQIILKLSKGLENEQAAQEMLDVLKREKAHIINDFLYRCYDAGKIKYVKNDIWPYMSKVPVESRNLLDTMIRKEELEEEKLQAEERPDSSSGLCAALAGVSVLAGLASDRKGAHDCNGDCDHCPAHYGYRYGRWYYGHGHQGGCERGGNGGASGRTYRD